ncbi:MAG: hypothetical protein Q9201_004032 [Fulgogasparrea decipioides]
MPPNTSTVASSSPTPLCAGGDSPLSTTANILSILIFALGLFASYVALISATRGAPAEIKRLVEDLRTTQREINRVAEYIFDDMHQDIQLAQDGHVARGRGVQYGETGGSLSSRRKDVRDRSALMGSLGMTAAMQRLHGLVPGVARGERGKPFTTSDMLYDEVENLLQTCVRLFYEADDLLKRSERDPYGLRRRILFIMNRSEVTDKMQKLADQKAKLAAIQMSLFLKYAVRNSSGTEL